MKVNTMMCMAPFPIFWSKLDDAGRAKEILTAYDEHEDTLDARDRVYRRIQEQLKQKGLLCSHPQHQPSDFKVHD